MAYALVAVVALGASALTFFSGFGLGTLLLPAFALYFPVPVAIGLTATVHLLNNLFKLTLMRPHIDWTVGLRFGLPAIVAALAGARLMIYLSHGEPLFRYTVVDHAFAVTPVNLAVGVLMLGFVGLELLPEGRRPELNRRHLVTGGVASGFFGGFSGHQGALRTMVLLRCGLDKNGFIATGVLIATLVDIARLTVYSSLMLDAAAANGGLLAEAVGAAFLGAMLGRRMLHAVTLETVHRVVAILLSIVAVALMAGWL